MRTDDFVTEPLTTERIGQFCVAMRDPNPVHRDPEFCASIGLPGIIAPGGMAVVALAHSVVRRVGVGTVRDIDVSMKSPVRAGERLRCVATEISADGDLVTFRVTGLGEDGRTCAEGIVTAIRATGAPA